METSSVLLVCILVTCSVWTVHGRNVKVKTDDQVDVQISVEADRGPGLCKACKEALKKVKKDMGPNDTKENMHKKLLAACNQITSLQKTDCRKYVEKHLEELIKELNTPDDVETICHKTGACTAKEMLDLLEDSQIEMNEYAWG
ncbi:NK-lysin tandem duplicate 4 isoform X3 [Dicentrarchus labrax]|uniref:Saposin B-type domain-containing protein n=1 Tax=Dicentrarchus labrax TaxID=13489 RepID=A0A8C4DRA5_DICLA|nr:NK-lysin tandem duplicate 4 isoform X2 [Dicentrarchus labrax]XP_051246595.1 NK-lysin tandem duplicate 4 isoform X3 [Dicentrarchus labrax]